MSSGRDSSLLEPRWYVCPNLTETVINVSHLAQWKRFATIPEYALEDAEVYLEGESKEHFMAFMRKMLQWEPERRFSALDLLQDQWLNS